MGRQRSTWNNIHKSLDVEWVIFLSDTWVYQWITKDSIIKTGKWLKIAFKKKLSSWKGKFLSYGGRLVLIKSVLSSLAMFMMSFFEVPKGILKKLDFYRSAFSGKVTTTRKSIDYWNGKFFVYQKIKEVLVSWILKFRMFAYLVNGCTN